MIDVPNSVTQIPNQGDIPNAVTILPQNVEEPENEPYLISFSRYNEKMCEIALLNSNKGKRAVEILKTIGTKICSHADFQRFKIDRIPVRREGEYKKLYSGLSPDIELKELKLQQDARIFYFDIEPQKMFYVVAVTENHIETDKVRR